MTFTLTQANSTRLPEYDTETQVGTFRAATDYAPLHRGAFDAFGTDQSHTSGSSTISQRGYLTEDSLAIMKTRMGQLRALKGKDVILFREFWADHEIHWTRARCLLADAQATKDTAFDQPVDMIFETAAPVWNGQHHGGGWVLDSGVFLDTGYYLDDGTTYPLTGGGTTTIDADNDGDAEQTAVRIEITAGNAAITAVTIKINDVTYLDYGVTYAGVNVAVGDVLIIDSGPGGGIYDDGTEDYAHLAYFFDNWLVLPPGENEIKITLVGGGTGSVATRSFFNAHN